jgi:glycosyltransferase involved in cell wall biosynthesis
LRLTVIGAPGEHTNTARLVRGLDLEDSVHFTGKVDAEDIVQHYSRSALAVVPSLYEGFGFPAGEAMACRVPVIATTAGALPEVVGTDGTTGMLIKPGCSKSLVEAIDGLLADPDRRRSLAEAGRARVLDLFSWRRAAERTVDVYREVLDERKAASC